MRDDARREPYDLRNAPRVRAWRTPWVGLYIGIDSDGWFLFDSCGGCDESLSRCPTVDDCARYLADNYGIETAWGAFAKRANR